jgi:hypothetical protein
MTLRYIGLNIMGKSRVALRYMGLDIMIIPRAGAEGP